MEIFNGLISFYAIFTLYFVVWGLKTRKLNVEIGRYGTALWFKALFLPSKHWKQEIEQSKRESLVAWMTKFRFLFLFQFVVLPAVLYMVVGQ